MKKKLIIFPVFFSAWLILMVHAVIPHHHHDHDEVSICNDCHSHDHHDSNDSDFLFELAENHNHDHSVCRFSVEILTQISLDQTFIPVSSDYSVPVVAGDLNIGWFDPVYIIKPLYLHNSQLRAPPTV